MPVSSCMGRQVIVDHQHVASLVHEIFGHRGRCIGGKELNTRWSVIGTDDDNRVLQGAIALEVIDDACGAGASLPNAAINTNDTAIPLINDGVDGNRRLARLAITQNKLALTATDGKERVDDFDAGLQWSGNRGTLHDRSRGTLTG